MHGLQNAAQPASGFNERYLGPRLQFGQTMGRGQARDATANDYNVFSISGGVIHYTRASRDESGI